MNTTIVDDDRYDMEYYSRDYDIWDTAKLYKIKRPSNGELIIPAIVEQYVLWLDGFIANGGKITHSYDYEWNCWNWLYAPIEFISNGECGASAKNVICESWVDPVPCSRSSFGGWGHNSIFLMKDYKVIGNSVPIFNDEIFDGFRDHV